MVAGRHIAQDEAGIVAVRVGGDFGQLESAAVAMADEPAGPCGKLERDETREEVVHAGQP